MQVGELAAYIRWRADMFVVSVWGRCAVLVCGSIGLPRLIDWWVDVLAVDWVVRCDSVSVTEVVVPLF